MFSMSEMDGGVVITLRQRLCGFIASLAAAAVTAAVLVASSAVLPASVAVAAEQPKQDALLLKKKGYTGRIRLSHFLDEPDGYCFDIPGPADHPQFSFNPEAHTCHPDPLMDQVFQFNTDGKGHLRWLYKTWDVCLTPLKAEAGSLFKWDTCAGDESLRSYVYNSEGQFQLKGTELCIKVETTGPAGFRTPVGEGQDAYGRGHSANAIFTHLVRDLYLQPCPQGDLAISRWRAY